MKHRLSFSFSASASVIRPGETPDVETKVSYADYRLDHVDYDASFYRQFFFGQGEFVFPFLRDRFLRILILLLLLLLLLLLPSQDHRNYVGIDEKFGPIAISVKRERAPTRAPTDVEEYRYRAIFRTREGCDLRTVFPEASVIVSSMIKSKPTWSDVIATINPSVNVR